MAGFENDIMFAKNADFTQADNQTPNETNGLITNGQLWIGRTAVNAGGTHIDVGTLTAGSGVTITNGPGSITVAVNGATVGQTITGDDGVVLSPTAGNWNILGQDAGAVSVMDTNGSVSTLRVEDRAWISQYVVDSSTTVGLRGTFSTIQSAINAASAPAIIQIRPGTYTENITLKNGIMLTGQSYLGGSGAGPTKIIGKIIDNGSVVNSTLTNLLLQTNSDNILALTGSGTSIVLSGCVLNCTNNTGINVAAATNLFVYNCTGDLGTTGIGFWTGAGSISVFNSTFTNSGSSLAASTTSGSVILNYVTMSSVLSTSSSGTMTLEECVINGDLINTTALTTAGTGTTKCYHCTFLSGSASAISVGSGTTVSLYVGQISSSNTNAITGLGTINGGGIIFIDTSSTVNTTTQVPLVRSNDAVKVVTPGAYPYTTVPQDELILVDTSVARTITPLASPTIGQKHIIKDNVGSAGSNNITITPSGKNIDGSASFVIATNWGSATIIYNGTQWNSI